MTALEKFLTATSQSMKTLVPQMRTSYSEFLLRNGRSFAGRPLPTRYRMRMPKMCYWNSYRLVVRSRNLRYCEGYVMCSDLPIPIEHAWAIDHKDQVVDVTLQDHRNGESRSGITEYFGIVFERHQLDPAREGSGLLHDHIGIPNLDLWYEIDPEFKALLEP